MYVYFSLFLFRLICSTFSSNCHFSSYSHLLLLGLKMSITQVPEFWECMCVGKKSSTQTCGRCVLFLFQGDVGVRKSFASLWFCFRTRLKQLHVLFYFCMKSHLWLWKENLEGRCLSCWKNALISLSWFVGLSWFRSCRCSWTVWNPTKAANKTSLRSSFQQGW